MLTNAVNEKLIFPNNDINEFALGQNLLQIYQ